MPLSHFTFHQVFFVTTVGPALTLPASPAFAAPNAEPPPAFDCTSVFTLALTLSPMAKVAARDWPNSPELLATRIMPAITPAKRPIMSHACQELTRVRPTTTKSSFRRSKRPATILSVFCFWGGELGFWHKRLTP